MVAAAADPDLHNLTVINGKNCEKIFGDRDRRTHRRQDKQRRTRDARNGQLKSQIAQFHGFILSLVRAAEGTTPPTYCRNPISNGRFLPHAKTPAMH
jgi:hypothetical protein